MVLLQTPKQSNKKKCNKKIYQEIVIKKNLIKKIKTKIKNCRMK